MRPYMPNIYNISSPFHAETRSIPQGFEHFTLTDDEYIAHLSGSDLNDDIAREHAIIEGYINDELFHILLDTGADISVIHSQVADIVQMERSSHNGINIASFGGDSTKTQDTGKIKITLKKAVYFGEFWICNFDPAPKFHLILGMDFLSKAGAVIDTKRRVVTFPEDHEIYMLPSSLAHVPHDEIPIFIPPNSYIAAGQYLDIPIPKFHKSTNFTYWMNRTKSWVSTLMVNGNDVPSHIRLTNITNKGLLARASAQYAACLITPGFLPIDKSMVRVHSNRYKEWQQLAFEGSFTWPCVKTRLPKNPSTQNRLPRSEFNVTKILTSQPSIHSMISDSNIDVDQSKMDTEWVIHEKDLFDPINDDLTQQLAFLPDLTTEPQGEINVDDLDFGEEDLSLEDKNKMRAVLEHHASGFISSGNGCPPAAIGTVCDIDVGDTIPIAIRARKVRPEWMGQLRDLLADLLKFGLIQFSDSPWASPIVIVMKKNKKDIRLCIDYRAVNSHTRILQSPMPMLDSFLSNYAGMKWFLSLDCASGFWVVPLTKRAQKISAFICPLGHFEWLRMPFGLKNAPMIYQRMVNNALFGFVSMPPGQNKMLNSGEPFDLFANTHNTNDQHTHTEQCCLIDIQPYQTKLKHITQTSFVDDVTAAAHTWDEIVNMVDIVLTLLRRWNISISALKSSFGKRSVDFLGHVISHLGLHAKPKDMQSFIDLPFPTTLQAMQSFLGCLNFFSRFIENFSVAAGCLYELTDTQLKNGTNLAKAHQAFTHLKTQYINMPILKHADRSQPFHIVLYTTPWAISATICQLHDDLLHPVRFCSRMLKTSELRHETWAKEILALLRVLRVGYYELIGQELVVYTQFKVLQWATEFKKTRKDHIEWSALLAPWNIKFMVIDSVDDKLKFAALLTTAMTPPDKLMDELGHLRPNKLDNLPGSSPMAPFPVLQRTAEAYVMTFDGSVCNTERLGSYGVVIWHLPEWTIEHAFNGLTPDATNNVAEYHGCIEGLKRAIQTNLLDLIVLGDSQLVLYQILGHKLCHKDHLKPLLAEALSLSKQFRSIQFHHILRSYNTPADTLARLALETRTPTIIPDDALICQLCNDNTVAQLLYKPPTHMVCTITTNNSFWSKAPLIPGPTSSIFHLEEFGPRMELLASAQDRETKLADIKAYLLGNTTDWQRTKYHKIRKIAKDFGVTNENVLRKLIWSTRHSKDAKPEWRIVIPDSMVQHVLKHCHSSLQGGHQGHTRTYERVRNTYFWHNMYQDVTNFVDTCLDCITSRPPPTKAMMAPTPGSLEPEFPFHTIGMDFATDMPKTHRGNKLLCVWTCWFTGYVICEALPDKRAQTVAEAYERCVFRHFGASVLIRHDRDPTFMSEMFQAFNDMLNQRQLPTFAYRPQANGTTERMIQTIIRAVKKYSAVEDNRDWDTLAERLAFAINTSYDTVRKNTPFFLVHGWDPLTTLQATMTAPTTSSEISSAWHWRQTMQSDYNYCLRLASSCLDMAKQNRAEEHNNAILTDERIKEGDAVWLYIDQVKSGQKKKLCHLWHGPFRVKSKRNSYSSILDLENLLPTKTSKARAVRRIHPEVHDSRLMLFRNIQRRPTHKLNDGLSPIDFNTAQFLPKDSYHPDLIITAVHDVRFAHDDNTNKRSYREYLVSLQDKPTPTWISDIDLPHSNLIEDFDRNRLNITRFNQMLDAEDTSDTDYTVVLDQSADLTQPNTPALTHSPDIAKTHQDLTQKISQQTQSTTDLHLQHNDIEKLLESCIISNTKYWKVKWRNTPLPSWHTEPLLLKVPNWKVASRAFEGSSINRSINTLHGQRQNQLPPLPEHVTYDSTSHVQF